VLRDFELPIATVEPDEQKKSEMITERPVRMAAILAGTLGLVPLLAESASGTRGSASSAPSRPSISTIDIAKLQPLLAQSDDLAPPPSPDASVTNPPPAPLAEGVPPPLPGYAWDPGHWTWDGTQYEWQPGSYIIQPTYGATFTPGYWRHYSGGWAWVDGSWNWGAEGEGE
jgi:hypothetical protein